MFFKFIIVLMLLIVLVSLFSGLFFLNRDVGPRRSDGKRTARALTVRIAVSLLLFGTLIVSYHLGWFGR